MQIRRMAVMAGVLGSARRLVWLLGDRVSGAEDEAEGCQSSKHSFDTLTQTDGPLT